MLGLTRIASRAVNVAKASLASTPMQRIFYVHVPKCGGTSISTAISEHYGFSGSSSRGLFHIDAVPSRQAADCAGIPVDQLREALLFYGLADPRVRFISGHVKFRTDAAAQLGSAWNVVTVLREPVSKWFSQYFYNRYKRSTHSRIHSELSQFIDEPEALTYGNDYVDYFSGYGGGGVGQQGVVDALDSLSKFAVVGLLEDLEDFRQEFHSRFGRRLRIGNSNKSPAAQLDREGLVSDELRRKVELICQPNLEVYRTVQEWTQRRKLRL